MKNTKFTSSLMLAMMIASNVSAYSKIELENMFKEKVYWNDNYVKAANYLATDKIIVNQKANPDKYELNRPLMRQEMAWVIRKVLKIEKKSKCDWKFKDLTPTKPNDWACFSVEPLLDKWYIAPNPNYRPEDSVSKAEALSFVIKSLYKKEYDKTYDNKLVWEENAIKFAKAKGLLREDIWNYKEPATRWFIFAVVHYANVLNNYVNISEPSSTWSTNTWTISTWSTNTWTISTWSTNTWTISTWSTNTWTISTWSTNTWSTDTTSTDTTSTDTESSTWSTSTWSTDTTSTDTTSTDTESSTWSTSTWSTDTTTTDTTSTDTTSTDTTSTNTTSTNTTSTDTTASSSSTVNPVLEPKPYDPCTDWRPTWPGAWEVNTKCFHWYIYENQENKSIAKLDIYWV